MSDARLRELERRWRVSGEVGAGEVFLRASVRAGRLSRERLELAAELGHPAAVRATDGGVRPLPAPKELEEVVAWLDALALLGREPALRAGLGIARRVFPDWERHSHRLRPRWARGERVRGRPRLDPRPGELLAALEAWAACPCPRHADALSRTCATAGEGVLLRSDTWKARAALRVLRTLLLAADGKPGPAARAAADSLAPEAPAELFAAVRPTLLPWALGLEVAVLG